MDSLQIAVETVLYSRESADKGISVSTVAISIVGSLIIATGSGWAKFKSEKTARRNESQRDALYNLQEHAVTLRHALEKFGDGTEANPKKLGKLTQQLDAAGASFDTARDRVRSDHVRDHCKRWRTSAELFWPGAEETDQRAEQLAWDYLCGAIATALRKSDA